MRIHFLLPVLLLFPCILLAQKDARHAFGDRLLLGMHYGFSGENLGEYSDLYEISHFTGLRAGISLARPVYAGIQSRFIRAHNFETPAQNFYMAGVWARCYLLHPALAQSSNRIGAFLESGFMMGNYAYEHRNDIEYYFERPGSWYIPAILGAEFRVWKNLTLEGSLNLIYNNGGSWDAQGIAYLSIGANWHW